MAGRSPWSGRQQGPPRIDLLPRGIREVRLVRRQRTGIGASFLVLLALLGLWYMHESRQRSQAEREADQERTVEATLRGQRAQLQPLADLEAQAAAAEQLRTQVYAREIRFSSIMRDVSAIMPDHVWLTAMSTTVNDVAGTGPTAAAGTGPTAAAGTGPTAAGGAPAPAGSAAGSMTPGSPGAGSPVATIAFAGSGFGHVDVGGFMRALARGPKKKGQPVYLNPYFTTSQKADQAGQASVTFSASVDLTAAAYSGRYQTQQPGTVTP
jgi:hypothetical protein